MDNKKFNIDEMLMELNEQDCDYLTEESFYPPSDNRYLKSYVKDINGGDNFADYCEYIFELLEEEEYYD
jgi:hypothetical protein